MSAKEYLIDKRIFSKQVLDSGLLNIDELIGLMEGYAASKPYSPEVARHLLKMRDLLIQRGDTDIDEVYHELYQIADSTFEKKNLIGETWAEMEQIAKEI